MFAVEIYFGEPDKIHGKISGKIDSDTHGAFDCVLGGKNMDNLYLLEAAILGNERIRGGGRIRVCKVDCPGFIN